MSSSQAEQQAQAEEAESKEECSWCRWMKAGGCKDQFEVWLKCVDGIRDAGREDVETCASVMGPLWDCMAEHSDYYGAQLEAVRQKAPGDEDSQAQQTEGEESSQKHASKGSS